MRPGTFSPLRLRLWLVPLSRVRLSRVSASEVPPGRHQRQLQLTVSVSVLSLGSSPTDADRAILASLR
eukprot:2164791-Prymnesium_polylepis.1